MQYYEDLSDYSYFLDFELGNVKNIGWLSPGQQFAKGFVKGGVIDKIEKIIVGTEKTSSCFNEFRSIRCCEICEKWNICLESNEKFALGRSEFWIPSIIKGNYFASPTLMYHYIVEHKYMPPAIFLESVENFSFEEHFNAKEIYLGLIEASRGALNQK